MTNPKIELKKVKMFQGRDGVGLSCEMYVNDKKVCHVFDDANGGAVNFYPLGKTTEEIKANQKIISELEEYATTLPEKPCPFEKGKTWPQNLDSIVNNILVEIEKEKSLKKMQKKFETHIIVGVENGDSYREFSYGKPVVKLSTLPTTRLQADINNIKLKLKDGEKILNTNLAGMGINI